MTTLELFKNENGEIVDLKGNVYTVRKSRFTAGCDALFHANGTQLDFWHELPKNIRDLFQ